MQGKDSNTWHLYMNENVDTSVATDDLKERLEIGTLKYDNYNNGINMSAYSKPFKVQVEYTQEQQANVSENGGDFAHDWSVFDFGIIERPRENIYNTIKKLLKDINDKEGLAEKIKAELADTMAMCGAHSISEITGDMIRILK